jgi:hypothetical protein
VIGLSDLVLLANAYGTSGIPPVPFQLGGLHVWEPGCDLAPPASVVGLSDLVTLALNYGKHWGYNLGDRNNPTIVVSPIKIGGIFQDITVTAEDKNNNPLNLTISVNGIVSGHTTPYTFANLTAITTPTLIGLPKNFGGGQVFDHWDVDYPGSGGGIHGKGR